jgi:NAD-dependent SIR2 family protein deacetylase
VNFKRAGRCRVCKAVWQCPVGSWEGGQVPRCPDCGGYVDPHTVPAGERVDAIADHTARGKRSAYLKWRKDGRRG